MKYQPVTCVWEVTMACNMRCRHCGSSCSEALPDELSTEEALVLCDQIAELGLLWITISGGEPLTRKDLPDLISRLAQKGVSVNMITNGWLLDESMITSLKESGISMVAISIDGTEKIHDQIRKPKAFAHARKAFQFLKSKGIQAGAVTTISKKNIEDLEHLKAELIAIGVDSWQVQLGLPMGNLKEQPDWILEPYQINDIINFCHKTALEGKIKIFSADCIGYYTQKELETKRISYGITAVMPWDGCNAGIRGFGILQNGDILGCTSIRSEEFLEGNIRKHTLREIWEDENGFLWRRNMCKSQMPGTCGICNYGSKCLGGCPNTKLTMEGSIYGENKYCAYHLELKSLETRYDNFTDGEFLFQLTREMIRLEKYQEAAFALKKVAQLLPEHINAWLAKGYCEYMCGNYLLCREANEKVLSINPIHAYALRGYGVAEYKLGNSAEGVKYVQKAAEMTGWADQDILMDLTAMQSASF